MEIVELVERQRRFSMKTFGPGKRFGGNLKHMKAEIAEIEQAPNDLMEYADLILIALDTAWRQGFTPYEIEQALVEKQGICRARKYPDWRDFTEDEMIHHIEEEEPCIYRVTSREWNAAFTEDEMIHHIEEEETHENRDS